MVRVVLVQPPHRDTFGYSMPPIGVLHAASEARARGHDVRFVDLALAVRRREFDGLAATDRAASPDAASRLIAACADRVLATRPDAVGIGAMLSSMPATLHLAAEIAARAPAVPIVLGGQGPETVEAAIVDRYPAIDAVAIGEADFTLADWLDAVERGAYAQRSAPAPELARIPGLVVRIGGRAVTTPPRPPVANLDEVPPIAWDLAEPPRAYAEAAGSDRALFPIDLGRGCSYACSFCTTPVFWGRTARHLSPTRAVDELDHLATLGEVECAYVTHDLFTFDRERVLAICEEKVARGNALPWECRTRIDLVDAELLEAMAAAGCRRILYGVESDRATVLARVNKGGRQHAIDVRGVLRTASEIGIASILGTMVGVPGESDADVEANLELMADAATVDGVSLSLHWFNVTPGNGRAAEVDETGAGTSLTLERGFHADLVRGHDVPVGQVAPEQWRLVEEDAEVFSAFRVFARNRETPRDLYLLTRNAHLLLEVMPRTLRAVARLRATSLRETLRAFFDDVAARVPPTRTDAADPAIRPPLLASADDPDLSTSPWVEAYVLERAAAVREFARFALALGRPPLSALAIYEQALFGTEEPQLLRFDADPRELVRAVDERGGPLPESTAPTAVLFVRSGEVVRSFALSDFMADVAEGLDAAALRELWPDADEALETAARTELDRLLASTDHAD